MREDYWWGYSSIILCSCHLDIPNFDFSHYLALHVESANGTMNSKHQHWQPLHKSRITVIRKWQNTNLWGFVGQMSCVNGIHWTNGFVCGEAMREKVIIIAKLFKMSAVERQSETNVNLLIKLRNWINNNGEISEILFNYKITYWDDRQFSQAPNYRGFFVLFVAIYLLGKVWVCALLHSKVI